MKFEIDHSESVIGMLNEASCKYEIVKNKFPAFNCMEGAAAREIPLENELKSILVKSKGNLFILNLRGDMKFSRKLVTKVLGNKFRMTNSEENGMMNMRCGYINPLIFRALNISHQESFLDEKVLDLEYIGTSIGTPEDGIIISVSEMLKLFDFNIVKICH